MLGVVLTLSLSATENPIEVTSAGGEAELPFREPVVDEASSAMEEVYLQQMLQQEIQQLRGLVEELAQQIQVMKDRQADRYQDLDRRLEEFRQLLNDKRTARRPADVPQTGEFPNLTYPLADDRSQSQTEKMLYDTSLELIRNRQYDLAITQLQAVISQYPEGQYAPNSYYWLGEIYAAKPEPDYEMARKALAQVISFFPEHRKVPDAAFKLGKVYHLMSDCTRAKELLNQVMGTYQGRSVAKLAESYLQDKVLCDSCECAGDTDTSASQP
jgi:tol-pal system protein YbgF|tara:strand:- start:12194 stop:13006 length:813 start_codon:yes stop_codon:yes gene_type:complete